MIPWNYLFILAVFGAGVAGCDDAVAPHSDDVSHGEVAVVEPAKGPHRGRLLVDGDFALELAIFETGVPPEFRVWATDG